MSAYTFTTVHNPKQGLDATVHIAKLKDAYHVPMCGTRANPKELVIQSGQLPSWITCERCRRALTAEGLLS